MAPAKPDADWAVLVYMCGDNDLESSAVADLREMKRVGSTDRLQVVVQVDRYHAGRPTRRYRLRKGTSLRSDAVGPPLGETNTGAPETLVDFARWAIDEFPARRTLLVLWNHGMGWDDRNVYARTRDQGLRVARGGRAVESGRPLRGGGRSTATLRRLADLGRRALFPASLLVRPAATAIGFDDHARDFLDTLEMQRAIRTIRRHLGRPVDVLGLDACLMSMVEVLHGMHGDVRCAVASEEIVPLEGWPYDDILRFLRANPEATPEHLATYLVRKYVASYARDRRVTLTATRMDRVDELAEAIDALARALLARRGDKALRLALEDARRRAWRSADTPEYVDLGGFCAALKRRTRVAAIRNAAAGVMTCLRRRIVLATASGGRPSARPTGLTIYLPDVPPETPMLQLYQRLPLVKRTAWGRVVRAFCAGW